MNEDQFDQFENRCRLKIWKVGNILDFATETERDYCEAILTEYGYRFKKHTKYSTMADCIRITETSE